MLMKLRAPDDVLGDRRAPYLLRWWILPRNNRFNFYLHHILRDDPTDVPHDHPYWNVSIVLRGGYWEIFPDGLQKWRRPGTVIFRRAADAHRLVLKQEARCRTCDEPWLSCWKVEHESSPLKLTQDAWTLFITGPRVRDWGFLCPNGWVFWRDFVSKGSRDNPRGGCE